MNFLASPATDLVRHLESGDVSSGDLTRAFLDRIESCNSQVRAFSSVTAEAALAQAQELDDRRSGGQAVGKLAGIPLAVKDVLCTTGQLTTCGSRMLSSYAPPYDATVIARLRAAGAVLLGKTNMDEFAMGSSTETSFHGPTANPWDRGRTPGGSSGGAAAAVAASMAPLSVGSDTGGSIRQPAAFCGVVGLKPTYGRVSRYGLVAFASSLDQVGPLAATAEDVALLLEVIAGHDELDSTSADLPVPSYGELLAEPLRGLRIGIVESHFADGLDGEIEASVRRAVALYEQLGATVHPVELPHSRYAIATYYIIASCEASGNLARYDGAHYGHRTDERRMLEELAEERRLLVEAGDSAGAEQIDGPLVRMYRSTRAEGFGDEVKRRIMLGTYALSAGYYDAYYLKALKVRRRIRDDFDAAFQQVDVIAGPVTPAPAFALGERMDDPLAMYLGDLYTVSANLAGIPALSLPCGFSESGLPIGLQLQAPPFEEARLLRAAHQYQQETDWHARRPSLVEES
ncbi:MAG: amidase family protein [Planctomycetota bacterium]|nr:amidase family protein [Planctomycetota bacterium]